MAEQRVTIVTAQGSTVSGVPLGPVGRAGSPLDVATAKGRVSGFVAPQTPAPRREASLPRVPGAGTALTGGGRTSLHATSVLPDSSDVRFLDALIIVPLAAGYVAFTASRPGNADLAWAAGGALLGVLAGVEGRGFLRYTGFAVGAGSGAYLGLRILGLLRRPG